MTESQHKYEHRERKAKRANAGLAALEAEESKAMPPEGE